MGDEFGEVAIAEERDDADETDGDGDEDSVPTCSGRVEGIGDANAGIRGGEEIGQEMEGQSAESGADAGEDGGPEKFAEESFALPLVGGIGGGYSAQFGRGEFGELRRKRTRDGRGFPPRLEAVGEVHVEFFGVKDGIDVATGNVEYAAGAALDVCPGDVDAIGGQKAGESVGMLDRGDLVLTESESGFFAAIADAIRTEEEIADVPVGVALVETRRGGGREADVDAAPGISLNALGSQFLVEVGEEIAATEAGGEVG